MVWYAAYGSNLCEERFHTYITGKTYKLTPVEIQADGCTSNELPTKTCRYTLDGWQLYFAGHSKSWSPTNGLEEYKNCSGVAFISREVEDSAAKTYCRLYEITFGQFIDIMIQENQTKINSVAKCTRAEIVKSLQNLTPSGEGSRISIGNGSGPFSYDYAMRLEDKDGKPVFTFTSQKRMHEQERTMPSTPYLATIVTGLIETDWQEKGKNDKAELFNKYLTEATDNMWHWPLLERLARQLRESQATKRVPKPYPATGTVIGTSSRLKKIREPIVQVPDDSVLNRPGFFRRLSLQLRTLRTHRLNVLSSGAHVYHEALAYWL